MAKSHKELEKLKTKAQTEEDWDQYYSALNGFLSSLFPRQEELLEPEILEMAKRFETLLADRGENGDGGVYVYRSVAAPQWAREWKALAGWLEWNEVLQVKRFKPRTVRYEAVLVAGLTGYSLGIVGGLGAILSHSLPTVAMAVTGFALKRAVMKFSDRSERHERKYQLDRMEKVLEVFFSSFAGREESLLREAELRGIELPSLLKKKLERRSRKNRKFLGRKNCAGLLGDGSDG